MNEASTAQRKRLYFRCHHTGMKENDMLIGRFAEEHFEGLSDDDVKWLESLLMNNNDIDIYEWIIGKKPVPAQLEHPVMRLLRNSTGAD